MTLGNRKSRSSRSSRSRGTRGSRGSRSRRSRSRGSRSRSRRSRGTRGKRSMKRKSKKKSRTRTKSSKKANQKKIMAYLKNIDTKQIGNLVKKYEQKHKKISMYYLTEYNEKTKQIKGEKMFMGDFIKRLKKDVNEKDFINECKLIKKGGKGQLGGGLFSANLFVTLSNITLAISTIYVVCVADSAAFTGLYAGFSAVLSGQCNSFAESSFRWIGFGNPVCNAWSSIVGNILLALGRDPVAILKITGIAVVIMKSRRYIAGVHGAWLKSVANVFVLGGMMDKEEYDRLDDITSLLPALTGQERAMLEDEIPDMSDTI